MDCDLLIKGGTVVDGSGAPAFSGAVAVKGGKITAVIRDRADAAAAAAANCRAVLDASGLTVCPGFIDMHSHADWIFPLKEHPSILAPLLEQGITTVIGGNCGYSPAPLAAASPYLNQIEAMSEFLAERPINPVWDSMQSFLEMLEGQGVALNLAMLSGHGTMRVSLFGKNNAFPGKTGLDELEKTAAASLEEGSFGISLGLGYAPGIFSEMRELEQMARCARRYNRLLTVHLKALSRLSGAYPLKLFGGEPHNLRALREIIAMAERIGVKLQISHLLFVGKKSWPTAGRALEMIEAAAARGLDIAFDSFPYLCGNTTIYVIYPTWFLNNIEHNFRSAPARLRLKLEAALITSLLGFGLADIQVLWGGHPQADRYNGMFFGEIAREMGCSVLQAYLKISELSKGKTLCLLHKYSGDASDETAYQKVLAHPLNLVETDTILTTRGKQNPASFGAFPRVIQRYHKELGLLSLEQAIAKMTGCSARRFGIKDRGIITEGNWADITLFDYNQIRDNTTLRKLEERPAGIKHVFINGVEAVREGRALPAQLSGRVLRA
ncbi:MAG: amidohydrolase family protein [Bacillota bacterium]